uniref:Uncharacterized protein n=1 Tax=Anguilla anguilla TaxID=7936 RepID=A0A0E9TUV9_ANGAN
MSSPSHLFG